MSRFFNLKKEDAHHAYLVEDEREIAVSELLDFLESEWGFTAKGNPDFWTEAYDTFKIDDARKVREFQSRRPIGEKKIIIIQTHFFTKEAQNALLKVLEEPVSDTTFFIITSNTESLLPTLKSRLFIILKNPQEDTLCGKSVSSAGGIIEEFLSAYPSKRIELLKDIIESKDKNKAIVFLNNLESTTYSQLRSRTPKLGIGGHRMSDSEIFVFKEIQKARSYLNDRSPSVKMILEHISFII